MRKILLAVVMALSGSLAATGVASADHNHHGNYHGNYGHQHSHHQSYYRGGYGGCATPMYQSYRPQYYQPSTQFYYQRSSVGYPGYAPRSSFGIYFGY